MMRVVTVRRVLQGSTDGVLTLGRLGEISNLHLALTISRSTLEWALSGMNNSIHKAHLKSSR